jgi:DNA-binding protein HU-beta
MNKNELIEAVSERANITKVDAYKTIGATIDIIVESVKNDEKVSIAGFGTFSANHRNSRKCRNPQTGDIIDVPAKIVPVFKAGKTFKDTLK